MKQQFVRYLVVGVGNTLLSFIAPDAWRPT